MSEGHGQQLDASMANDVLQGETPDARLREEHDGALLACKSGNNKRKETEKRACKK